MLIIQSSNFNDAAVYNNAALEFKQYSHIPRKISTENVPKILLK